MARMTRIKYKEAVGIQAEWGKPSIGAKPSKSKLKKLRNRHIMEFQRKF